MANWKVNLPVFTRVLLLGLKDRGNKDIAAADILTVKEVLGLVKESVVLCISEELYGTSTLSASLASLRVHYLSSNLKGLLIPWIWLWEDR